MATTFTIQLRDAQKASLTAKAEAAGINPAGGTLPTQHGVTLSFVVNGDEVVFTVVSKPFFVSVDMIKSGIEGLINSEA
jgi:hypothetical protein